jgi:uncharacterized membrane protein
VNTLSVLVFNNAQEAEQALKTLQHLRDGGVLKIDDAALLHRDGEGNSKIKQLHTLADVGVLGGAFWGMLIGLVFFFSPMVGLIAGAGTTVVSTKMGEIGINGEFTRKASEEILPGQAALFLFTHEAVVERVVEGLKPYHFKLLRTSLSPEDEQRLHETFST